MAQAGHGPAHPGRVLLLHPSHEHLAPPAAGPVAAPGNTYVITHPELHIWLAPRRDDGAMPPDETRPGCAAGPGGPAAHPAPGTPLRRAENGCSLSLRFNLLSAVFGFLFVCLAAFAGSG